MDGKVQWQEGEYTVTRTCQWSGPGCHDGCGVLFYTKNGRLEKVEGDPDNPYNQGKLCMRCLTMTEAVNHPDRLKYPLRRVGERGENKWERISWDEAYDIIEKNVKDIQREYGGESIISMVGTGRNVWSMVPKFTYDGLQSPNFGNGFLSGESCYLPRAAAQGMQAGDFFVADCSQMFEDRYENPEWQVPKCIVIWGNNPIVSNADGFFGHWIVECMKRGSKLITIDPRLTWLASRSEHWLQIRPGTDAALALGMLNVIINEDLYDHDFVERWTYGFEDLTQRVQEYTPEKVAEITWIPKDQIIAAARMYATSKPAAIQWGLAIDTQLAGIEASNALGALWAITGNLDVPGGNILVRHAGNGRGLAAAESFWGWFDMPEELRAKRLGLKNHPLYAAGFAATDVGDEKLIAIETGKPYPIKMGWFQSTNTFANMSGDSKRVREALKKIPFNVVVDLFMTPTAVACADIVLPCAMSLERDSMRAWWSPLRSISKVTQYEECKSDEEICYELGKRLNPEKWPWDTLEDMLDWCIENTGMKFKELEQKVYIYDKFEYRKHEKGLLRVDGKPGFNTFHGLFNLKFDMFEEWGLDPLPSHIEPPESPNSTPELFKEYPLILTTGRRSWEFFHSEHRQLKTSREFHPDPLLEINPETAALLGINEGDWVWIENKRGKCKQKAKLTPGIHPKIVMAEHGWWFPERKGSEADGLFGVFDSNINNLMTMNVNGPTGYGAPYKNMICKVYKV